MRTCLVAARPCADVLLPRWLLFPIRAKEASEGTLPSSCSYGTHTEEESYERQRNVAAQLQKIKEWNSLAPRQVRLTVEPLGKAGNRALERSAAKFERARTALVPLWPSSIEMAHLMFVPTLNGTLLNSAS